MGAGEQPVPCATPVPVDLSSSNHLRPIDPSFPPIISESKDVFYIHPYLPKGVPPQDPPTMRWVNDDFKAYFYNDAHFNFFGQNSSDETVIVSILRKPVNDALEAIKITKKDHLLFE